MLGILLGLAAASRMKTLVTVKSWDRKWLVTSLALVLGIGLGAFRTHLILNDNQTRRRRCR